MNTNFDPDGMTNVMIGLIKQTREDYVKGAKRIIRFYGYILPEEDLMKDKTKYRRMREGNLGRTTTNNYHSACHFVKKDPYELFSNCTTEEIFNSWDHIANVRFLKDEFRENYPKKLKTIQSKMKKLGEEKLYLEWVKDMEAKQKKTKKKLGRPKKSS